MVLTRQHGKGTRNGVKEKVFGRTSWILCLVSYGYQKGLINVNDLSVDSSIVSAKKGRGKRLATMVTRRRKESGYML
jgi:hypothetical protein